MMDSRLRRWSNTHYKLSTYARSLEARLQMLDLYQDPWSFSSLSLPYWLRISRPPRIPFPLARRPLHMLSGLISCGFDIQRLSRAPRNPELGVILHRVDNHNVMVCLQIFADGFRVVS
ncbi:hypothetical protein BDV11DRAFT_2543 [Aspergillus similis]